MSSPSETKEEFDRFGFAITTDEYDTRFIPTTAGPEPPSSDSWDEILANWDDWTFTRNDEIRYHILKGVPGSSNSRSRLWRKLSKYESYSKEYPQGYFKTLTERGRNESTDQILLDLERTFPTHKIFKEGNGKRDLLVVLNAYAWHQSAVGYCQGINFLVAVLLMQDFHVEECFWILASMLDRNKLWNFFEPQMSGLIQSSVLFSKMLAIHNYEVYQHLQTNRIDPLLYLTPMWMQMFSNLSNWDLVLRIWDLFFFEGKNFLYKASLSILSSCKSNILSKKGIEQIVPYILRIPSTDLDSRNVADLACAIDVERLADIACSSEENLKAQEALKSISNDSNTNNTNEKENSKKDQKWKSTSKAKSALSIITPSKLLHKDKLTKAPESLFNRLFTPKLLKTTKSVANQPSSSRRNQSYTAVSTDGPSPLRKRKFYDPFDKENTDNSNASQWFEADLLSLEEMRKRNSKSLKEFSTPKKRTDAHLLKKLNSTGKNSANSTPFRSPKVTKSNTKSNSSVHRNSPMEITSPSANEILSPSDMTSPPYIEIEMRSIGLSEALSPKHSIARALDLNED